MVVALVSARTISLEPNYFCSLQCRKTRSNRDLYISTAHELTCLPGNRDLLRVGVPLLQCWAKKGRFSVLFAEEPSIKKKKKKVFYLFLLPLTPGELFRGSKSDVTLLSLKTFPELYCEYPITTIFWKRGTPETCHEHLRRLIATHLETLRGDPLDALRELPETSYEL